MLKIMTGRDTRSARKKIRAETERALRKGEEVPDYFIVPNKRAKESEADYTRRLWRLNEETVKRSGGPLPESQLTLERFREETESRAMTGRHWRELEAIERNLQKEMKPTDRRYKGELERRRAKVMRDALKEAAVSQARAQYTPEEQVTAEQNARLLAQNNAYDLFKKWSGVSFDPKHNPISYDSASSTYSYGNVRFGIKYKRGKNGNPGGLHFIIRNISTGEEWTDDDLYAQEQSRQADLAMAREERAMRMAKLKEENPELWEALEEKRLYRNELARKRYRKKHPKKRKRK